MKRIFLRLKSYLKRSDTFLLGACLAATLFGIVLIASAVRYTGSMKNVYVQILALIMGIFAYMLFSVIDIDILAARWRLLTLLGLALIVSLRWLGTNQGGNRAWIRFAGIGIQPAELVKIAFIITMAYLITMFKDRERLDSPLSVMVLGLVFIAHFGAIIVFSGDTGSALVYLFIFIVMLFAGGIKLYWMAAGGAALALLAPYIWYYFLNDNYRTRILAVFIPEVVDPTGRGVTWQPTLCKRALVSGGFFGQGLFQGPRTQAGKLPLQNSDFIFAVVGEEFGVIGCIAVIALLTVIIVRVVQVGIQSQSRMEALVCIGIASMLAFQTLDNIGMCIGVAPVIGLTLPFFSYGGSSIVTLYAAMGIVSGIKMKPKPMMFMR